MAVRDDALSLVKRAQGSAFGYGNISAGLAAVATALLEVADAIRENR